MADRLAFNKVIRIIHRYSAFLITGSLLMYILTGFIMTRYKLFPPGKEETVSAEYPLAVDSMSEKDLAAYIQKEFGLRGHRGKALKNGRGETTILYNRPGIRHQAVLSPDMKKIKITTTRTSARATVVAFHRMKDYGGGAVYDLYVFMTDITALSIIVFSVTGLYMGLIERKNILIKLILLGIGISYTLLVIFSFMLS
ncbi:MAG TPA: PepSY-associated TM helix domain-containing protein [Bacteroidales bacterium]|jgi:hypothetical protein|nr:PepSY-associated TM helix domain-containing protein [Bacteroidales bacterium]